MGAVVTVGNGAEAGGQCEFTIAYQDLCSRSEPHWCFWFGGPGDIAYHGLACAGGRRLVGLDPVTNRYQSPDLALLPPRETFTNHYHRDGGLGIDVSVGVEVRWHGSRVNVM
jgi:hypothetical protein